MPSPWFHVPVQEPTLSVHSEENADSRGAHSSLVDQLTLVSTRPAFDMGILDRAWLGLFNESCANSQVDPEPQPQPQPQPKPELSTDEPPPPSDTANHLDASSEASAAVCKVEPDTLSLTASLSSTSVNGQEHPLDSADMSSVQQPSPAGLGPPADDDECFILSVTPGTRRPKRQRRRGSKSIPKPPSPTLRIRKTTSAQLLSRRKFEAIISSLELRCYSRMLELCLRTDGIVGIEFDESTVCDVCRQVRSIRLISTP